MGFSAKSHFRKDASYSEPGTLPITEISLGLLLLLGMAWAGAFWLRLPVAYVGLACALYGLMGTSLCYCWLNSCANSRPAMGFGWANRITLMRAVPVLLIAALVPFPEVVRAHGWGLAYFSLGALILDGVDGNIARHTGSCSAFGARFDMELDAFFILVLTLLIISTGKAGPWVLALGLLRYGFVLAGRLWPWLERPLPESFRRKTVCVWQVVTLLVCLLPPVGSAFASGALAVALTLLIASFTADLRWLSRNRHGVNSATTLQRRGTS